MADKKPIGPDPENSKPQEPDYDVETSTRELGPREIHVIGTSALILAATKAAMDARAGTRITHFKVKTFETEGKVRMTYVPPGTEGSKALRLNKRMSTAQLAFSIPLKKLGVSLAPDRMLAFTKVTETFTEKGELAWEVTLKESENRPRNVDLVALALVRQVKAAKQKARRDARRRKLAEQANVPLPSDETAAGDDTAE